MRKCTQCKHVKQDTEFYPSKRVQSGFKATCKACDRAWRRKHYAANAEKERQYASTYYKNNRELCGARVARSRLNPEAKKRERARNAINNAVSREKITKPTTCSGCDQAFESRKIEAHHPDHNKQLEVKWLCSNCHNKLHHPHLHQI